MQRKDTPLRSPEMRTRLETLRKCKTERRMFCRKKMMLAFLFGSCLRCILMVFYCYREHSTQTSTLGCQFRCLSAYSFVFTDIFVLNCLLHAYAQWLRTPHSLVNTTKQYTTVVIESPTGTNNDVCLLRFYVFSLLKRNALANVACSKRMGFWVFASSVHCGELFARGFLDCLAFGRQKHKTEVTSECQRGGLA